MTKQEMINEMFDKGYASQYTPQDFMDWFTDEQIERFYKAFMDSLWTDSPMSKLNSLKKS